MTSSQILASWTRLNPPLPKQVTYRGNVHKVVGTTRSATGQRMFVLKSRFSGGSNFAVLRSDCK
jgi:hypothetical protein